MGRKSRTRYQEGEREWSQIAPVLLSELQHKDHLLLLDHPIGVLIKGQSGRIAGEIHFWTDEPMEEAIAATVCRCIGPCAVPYYQELGEWRLGLTVIHL